ncbi:MAG: hypothetical protein HOJ33_01135 [Gammaproteobacteria bacterium]|jgi:exonuclease III|nr:hypothetical protein [Gammaproteobacteria bacterium]
MMRIVSWNMRKNKKAWPYFFESLNPDIALLQESSPLHDDFKFNIVTQNVKKNLNNSILFKNSQPEQLLIEDQHQMGVLASEFKNQNNKIFLLSIYGNLSFTGTLDYVLLETIEFFINEMRNKFQAQDIIISGDFNMDRRMDENPTTSNFSKKGETRHEDFFDGILNLGFHDCLRKFHSLPIQTYRHNRGTYPWELDHMFATPELYNRLKSINVYIDENILSLSDHNPIVAEFED